MTIIELGDLTPRDQGRTVTITDTANHGATITGMLNQYRIDSDWIDISTHGDAEPREIRGQQTMEVTVGRWTTSNLPLDTRVEVER